MHYPNAKPSNVPVALVAAVIALVGGHLVGEDRHFAVNFLVGTASIIATGIVIASFFQKDSDFSVAQNAFRIFTIFLTLRIPMFFAAYFYGQYDTATEFLSYFEKAFFTGHAKTARGLSGSAFTFSIGTIIACTIIYYMIEDETQWPVTMFCLWTIILGMITLGFVMSPI